MTLATDYVNMDKSMNSGTENKEGMVEEALPNITFRVKLSTGIILAHLSGKMRLNRIRVLPGDRVLVEMNQYDATRGRIIRRL